MRKKTKKEDSKEMDKKQQKIKTQNAPEQKPKRKFGKRLKSHDNNEDEDLKLSIWRNMLDQYHL